jgi:hypothetical protein
MGRENQNKGLANIDVLIKVYQIAVLCPVTVCPSGLISLRPLTAASYLPSQSTQLEVGRERKLIPGEIILQWENLRLPDS